MNVATLFVYGTLRVGNPLYAPWIKEAVIAYEIGLLAKGALYNVSAGLHASYPVAKFDHPGLIVGDLIFMEADRHYHAVCDMERGAGYDMKEIKVYDRARDEILTAMAFDYRMRPQGSRILSGDWNRRELSRA